jgi:hypothetical protein
MLKPFRSRWFSGTEMFIGVAWTAVIVLASVGGLIDSLHG